MDIAIPQHLQGPKFYAILGKMLCEQKPDIASELSNQLEGETDLSKLSNYLVTFCQQQEIHSSFITGALFKNSLIEKRRLFVGVILAIYQPHTRALAISLANLLRMHKQQMSRMIEETNVRYKSNCEDFKVHVDLLVDKMREV